MCHPGEVDDETAALIWLVPKPRGPIDTSGAQLTLFLPFLLLSAIALWRSGVWERRVIREELAEEVGDEQLEIFQPLTQRGHVHREDF